MVRDRLASAGTRRYQLQRRRMGTVPRRGRGYPVESAWCCTSLHMPGQVRRSVASGVSAAYNGSPAGGASHAVENRAGAEEGAATGEPRWNTPATIASRRTSRRSLTATGARPRQAPYEGSDGTRSDACAGRTYLTSRHDSQVSTGDRCVIDIMVCPSRVGCKHHVSAPEGGSLAEAATAVVSSARPPVPHHRTAPVATRRRRPTAD